MPTSPPLFAEASQLRRSQSSSASPRRAPGSVRKDDSACPANGKSPPRSLSSTVPHPTLEISRQADDVQRLRCIPEARIGRGSVPRLPGKPQLSCLQSKELPDLPVLASPCCGQTWQSRKRGP